MVKKGQYYIIEATLAGIALMAVISYAIYFGNLRYETSDEYILNNYCEDSLQVLIKRNLLQNDADSINELNMLIPDSIVYCLRIGNESVNDYGCSKLKDRIIVCKSIYNYMDINGTYYVEEVRLLLS